MTTDSTTRIPDRRPLAGHLNYARDVSHMLGEVVGPNQFGERLVAVEVSGDGRRVGFDYAREGDGVNA